VCDLTRGRHDIRKSAAYFTRTTATQLEGAPTPVKLVSACPSEIAAAFLVGFHEFDRTHKGRRQAELKFSSFRV
jgi:hypothetical protein